MQAEFFNKKGRKHLMLVDGNSLINRAFYASSGRAMLTTPDGQASGAVYTFLNMLLSYQEMIQPDNMVVAFDVKAKTFRHDLYSDYKGTRRPMPDDLRSQIPLAKEMLDALNICRYEEAGFEADDIIGSLAKQASEEGFSVYIVTGDKDSLQLIRDQVFVVLPVTSKGTTSDLLMDREAFFKEYHFNPEQFVDYKAIMGDSSDNIPGIKGIGKVGAGRLIEAQHSLAEIYQTLGDDPEKIDAKYRQKLLDDRASAQLSYDLAQINRDMDLGSTLSASKLAAFKPDKLTAFFLKMGFQSMFSRFGLAGSTKVLDPDKLGQLDECKTLEDFLKRAGKGDIVWLLAESGLSYLYCKEAGFLHLEKIEVQLAWDFLSHLPNQFIVWDYKNWLKTLDLGRLQKVFDVQVAAYLLDQGKAEDFASVFQAIYQENFPGLPKKPKESELRLYYRQMAYALALIYDKDKVLLSEQEMEFLAYEIEMPLTPLLAQMEKTGVRVDKDGLSRLSDLMREEMADLEKQIFQYSDSPFNLNSSQQLSEVLFNQLGLPTGKKLASGYYSTAAGELAKLRNKHPIVDLILDYREVSKLTSTFVDGLSKSVDPVDGRIHTTYHQCLTSTGRLSSSDPNLQNIPVRSERSKAIREVFIADEGWILMGADYSQIELRLLAHLSQDPNLIAAFRDNLDIHTTTAMRIFGKPKEEITGAERSLAKTVNFSIIYGVSAFGLAQDLKSTIKEAKSYIQTYYDHYDQVRPYLDSLIEKAKSDGYVETLYGRRRYIPELKSSQFQTRSFGERAAMNAPLQGTAADLIKLAMNKVSNSLKSAGCQARIILQVHDELILEVPEKEVAEVTEILREGMEGVAELKVPLLVDVQRGKSWADI